MGKFIGRQADIGIGKESVRGTAVAPTFWIPQLNLTFDEMVEQAIDESSVGVIEDAIDANVTEKFAEGTLEGIVRAESFGLILLNAIGSVVTTPDTPEAGVHSHAFSVLQSGNHPSLTIGVAEPNGDKEFALGMITSLELSVALNEYIQFTAEIRSKVGAGASLTPTYVEADEQKLFLPQHGEFKFASDLAGLTGASAVEIKGLTLTVDKNVEDNQVIGNVEPADICNKQFSIEGSVEIMYEDQSYVTDLLADTKSAVRLTLENTDIIIGATSSPKMEIDLANVKFSEVTKPFSNDDLIVQTLSFKAFYDISDAKMLDITLINETTAY